MPQVYNSGMKGLVQFCYRIIFFSLMWSVFSWEIVFDTYQLGCYMPFVASMSEHVNVNCGVERYCNAGSGEVMI